ncbi:MAG: methylmalonyl-CoA mutase family protein [Flavobacteriaceae bacterium]
MSNTELLGLEWKNKLIDDLGLEKYNRLFSKSIEDVVISPFYTENNQPINLLIPDQWNILGEVKEVKFIEACNEINEFLKNDINHITLYHSPKLDTKKIIQKFNNSDVIFFIKTDFVNDLDKLKNNTHFIIFEQRLENDKILELQDIDNRNFKININSASVRNKGANIIQEIAFMLSLANEYLNIYGCNIAKHISFELTQGSNYFFEISKIQVLRILWSIITNEHGEQIDDTTITSIPSLRNKTIKNYNNNIIRSTSECISGILGGCNFIKSIPYDSLFNEKNEFSQRIMNNQLLILKNETHLDKVSNAIEGCYYINDLIRNISEKSLSLFKKIEKNGGYFESHKNGFIKEQIEQNNRLENSFYDSNKNILVGFNKYIDDSKIISEEHLLELKKKSEILNMDIERIAKTELE